MTTVEQPQSSDAAVEHDALATVRRALQRLKPISPNYQTAPIMEGFNWNESLADIEAGEWYLVAFRSLRRANANEALLIELDERAQVEARATGGLLFYFAGELDEQRRCVSFCVWRSQAEAQAGARLPMHAAAMEVAGEMYEWYFLERYQIAKRPGSPDVIFQPLS